MENKSDPVLAAIDAAINSLNNQPNQFHLTVNITGFAATSYGSGTAATIQAIGGGPGSITTGLHAVASSDQMNIAHNKVDRDLKEQATKAISLLSELKTLLQQPSIDKPTIMARLNDLTKTYVAPVFTSVMAAIIKAKLGL